MSLVLSIVIKNEILFFIINLTYNKHILLVMFCRRPNCDISDFFQSCNLYMHMVSEKYSRTMFTGDLIIKILHKSAKKYK